MESEHDHIISLENYCRSNNYCANVLIQLFMGAEWLSGRVLDLRPRGCGFKAHRRHYVVSLSKNINPSSVLVQPRRTRPLITERLLMGRKESNQAKQLFMNLFTCEFVEGSRVGRRVGPVASCLPLLCAL